MSPGAKTFAKATLVGAAVAAGIWFLVVQAGRWLHANPSANRVWFYDEAWRSWRGCDGSGPRVCPAD